MATRVVKEMDSFTRGPLVKHRIALAKDGQLICTCEDFMWRVFGQEDYRPCKHIRRFLGLDGNGETLSEAEKIVVQHTIGILTRFGLRGTTLVLEGFLKKHG